MAMVAQCRASVAFHAWCMRAKSVHAARKSVFCMCLVHDEFCSQCNMFMSVRHSLRACWHEAGSLRLLVREFCLVLRRVGMQHGSGSIGCNHLARQARFFFFVDEECRNEGSEGVLGSLLLTVRSLLQSREHRLTSLDLSRCLSDIAAGRESRSVGGAD
jgi:hypothetical protein